MTDLLSGSQSRGDGHKCVVWGLHVRQVGVTDLLGRSHCRGHGQMFCLGSKVNRWGSQICWVDVTVGVTDV